MADEKKPEAPKNHAADVAAEMIGLFFLILILGGLFSSISNRLDGARLFGSGWLGLSPKNVLLLHTRPISSLSNPIGAKVVTTNKTDVYDAPGGKKIGSQRFGVKGKILQGPVDIGGKRYWYVDFDSGQDGWVSEDNMAYLETEPSLVEWLWIGFYSYLGYIQFSIIIFCILCFLYILYLNAKISPILENERKLLYPVLVEEQGAKNMKWEKVVAHVDSLNENDWRIAIIEADILLGELLEKLSLPGDTIGDKLKAVEKSDFRTLDDAWEAHKTRNRISHDGQDFALSQREAKTVIGLYEKVFKEFEII